MADDYPITPVTPAMAFRLRAQRKAHSDSSLVSSSRDSGYDSKAVHLLSSPSFPGPMKLPEYVKCGNHLDGNDSSDHSSSDESGPITPRPSSPVSSRPGSPSHGCPGVARSATLPRSSFRARPQLPAAFFSSAKAHKGARRSSDASPGRKNASSLRHPDRFVHSRDLPTNLGDKFRTAKYPHELSRAERFLRNTGSSPDPFFTSLRRNNTSPMSPSAARQARMTDISQVNPQTRAATILHARRVSDGIHGHAGIGERLPSGGSVWSIGGLAAAGSAIDDGHGHLITSGTNAPLFRTAFTARNQRAEEEQRHEGRIAAALELDLASRVLDVEPVENRPADQGSRKRQKTLQTEMTRTKTFFNGVVWVKEGLAPSKIPHLAAFFKRYPHLRSNPIFYRANLGVKSLLRPAKARIVEDRSLPSAPFKVLDAPNLRDDFYCSILAYSPTCHTLAIGLGDHLYSWSESTGVKLLNSGLAKGTWVTAVAFSSSEGCKSILAFGRNNHMLGLCSMYESGIARMAIQEAAPISCLSWRPTSTIRPSRNPNRPGVPVRTEDLLVGDESGHILYYVVEWPDTWEVERDGWQGEMTLMARISAHRQQICGLAWSKDGRYFASGGNDNLCYLFEVDRLFRTFQTPHHGGNARAVRGYPIINNPSNLLQGGNLVNTGGDLHAGQQFRQRPNVPLSRGYGGPVITGPFGSALVSELGPSSANYRWEHGAAVKAIAFCPWQDSLVATGGGSNDKCIHFFHTTSGATLATIAVSAQVTSLIWSSTRREIAATFGYAQPDHPVRIAVFSWPECAQVAAIPWEGEHRALYAIPYPRASVARDGRGRTLEGCIVVAASDESVKFHEVWPVDGAAGKTAGGVGMLGGSDILEDLEGIDKEGDVIR